MLSLIKNGRRSLAWILLALPGCSGGCGSHALYLKAGVECVLEKPVTVQASVPGADGKLVPNTQLELPAGTLFKYGGASK